jgi:hypothetical protein
MRLSVIFPFVDFRRLFSDLEQFKPPPWSYKNNGYGFVPKLGSVSRKINEDFETRHCWEIENNVKLGSKALNFGDTLFLAEKYQFKCVTKNLLFDEQAIGFCEIAIENVKGKKNNIISLTEEEFSDIVKGFLSLWVKVGNCNDSDNNESQTVWPLRYFSSNPSCFISNPLTSHLISADEKLTNLFQSATSKLFQDLEPNIDNFKVQPCYPLLLVTYNIGQESSSIPYWLKAITRKDKKQSSFPLYHSFIDHDGNYINTWIFGHNHHEELSVLEQIKLLHIENEAVRQVLKNILKEDFIVPNPRTSIAQNFDNYFYDSNERIKDLANKLQRELGINLLKSKLGTINILEPHENIILKDKIAEMRFPRKHFRKVSRYLDQWTNLPALTRCYLCNNDCPGYRVKQSLAQNLNKIYDLLNQLKNKYPNQGEDFITEETIKRLQSDDPELIQRIKKIIGALPEAFQEALKTHPFGAFIVTLIQKSGENVQFS